MKIYLALLTGLSISFFAQGSALGQDTSAEKSSPGMPGEHHNLGQYFDELASQQPALAQSYDRLACGRRCLDERDLTVQAVGSSIPRLQKPPRLGGLTITANRLGQEAPFSR
jgi:hypothetical protein